MIALAALILMLLAFAIVGLPLLQPPPEAETALEEQSPEDDELAHERDSLYAAIKELQFERDVGNLSAVDYEALHTQYRDDAAKVLQRLDAMQAAAARQERQRNRRGSISGSRGCPECSGPVERGDRFCGSCGADLMVSPCRSCGAATETGDRFCPGCGSRLGAG